MIGIQMPMSAIPGRIYAIKEIHATVNCLQYVCRGSDSHQISRLILRQMRNRHIQNMVHLFMTLANRQSANRISIQIQLGNCICMCDPDIIKIAP